MSLPLNKSNRMRQKSRLVNGSLAGNKFNRGNHILDNTSVYVATAVSLLGLGFSAMTIVPGLSIAKASATEASSKVNVDVASALSITLEAYDPTSTSWATSDELSLDLAPDAFKTATARVTAGTNSSSGLVLSMNDSDSNNALIESNDTPSAPTKPVIASITSDVTIDDPTDSTNKFAGNTWGYNLTSTTPRTLDPPTIPLTYSEVPITEEQIIDTGSAGEVAYNFTMATRIDSTLPAGTYEDQVVFTAVANPEPVPVPSTLFDLDGGYMQSEYLATMCASATTPSSSATDLDTDGSHIGNTSYVPSITMLDERDNQSYTIRKLADGNCWMTENLRYGINPDGTAHPYVQADAVLSDNIDATADLKMQDLTYDSTNPNTAGRIKNGNSGMKTADNSQDAFFGNGDNFTEPYINIYQANDTADYDGQTKYGVLYNYCAVTGGTACTAPGTDYNPTGSVCPKGWKLPGMTADPTGSSGDSSGATKTYDNVFNLYGVTNSSAGFNKIIASPFNFVRSGFAFDGSLYSRSSSGLGVYWSSTKYASTSGAYDLDFGSSRVNRYDSSRYYGYSARCVSE